jgi:sugar lactone lactonase YvrE
MLARPAERLTAWRLGGRARKTVLLLHIIAAGTWFGLDVAMAVLVFTAIFTESAEVRAHTLQSLRLVTVWPMFSAAMISLITGVILGLGSKYGLLRYWWVASKLALNIRANRPSRKDRGHPVRRQQPQSVDGASPHRRAHAERDDVQLHCLSDVAATQSRTAERMGRMSEPQLLAADLVIGESARWHDGRVWLSNWGAQEILAFDQEGNREVITRVPTTIPFSIDWLPDGQLLVVAGPEQRLLRQEPDGSLVDHVDLTTLPGGLNEIVVDGRGTIYVNGGADFYPDEGVAPGFIAAITPDGMVRQVADGIAFPNGMAVTDDNSTLIIAESFAGQLTAFDITDDGGLVNRRTFANVLADGISMDAEGAVWTPSWLENESCCVRVADGGEVLERIPLEYSGFACALGGADGRTLFMLTADWHMDEDFMDNLQRLTTGPRTGQLLTATVSVPSAGWPNHR